MLGNRDDRQKQRNQIVFKLLKSMDPFLPSLNQHDDIRHQILKILKQNAYNIIPEQNSSDEQQVQSLNLSTNHAQNKRIARSLASKVFDVTVANGGWLNSQKQNKKKQLQIALSQQLQAQRQSKIVRKQIEIIQNDVHKKFINKKLSGTSADMNTYYQSTINYPISNYSSLKYNNETPIKNFNRISEPNSNARIGLINLPSSRSIYTQGQNYNGSSIGNQNSKGFQIGWQSQKNNQYSNDFQNYYSDLNHKDYRTLSYHNENHNENFQGSNTKLTEKTNKFTELRLQLSHFQSPIKRYRHETDKLLSKNNQNNEQNKEIYKNSEKSQLLGLQSKISNKSKIIKSKSELILKKHDRKEERAQKLQVFNSKHRSLSKRSSKIQNFLDQNPKIKLNISRLNKKVSQKTLQQSQKLDMQIMASLLHRKMRDYDKSNTIASLIK